MKAARLRGIHVAVAGDDPNALAQLTESLRDDGALVTIHDSAQSLERLMRQLLVNVLVLDFNVRPSDAPAFVRDVRALPKEEGGRVLIIALVAGTSHNEPRLVAADVDSIVSKPADIAELVRTINRLQSAHRRA